MAHVNGLLSPARVLHRVLLLRLANVTTRQSNALSSIIRTQTPSLRLVAPNRHVRAFSATTRRPAPQRPTNYDIPYTFVRIADESGLSAPQLHSRVMENLPEGFVLEMVGPPPAQEVPVDGEPAILQPQAPVCRIVDGNRLAEQEAEKAAKEALEAEHAKITKTLELNWGITKHDLAHKLKRLTEFLERGLRVEIMLARKRNAAIVSPEQSEELVESVKQAALAVKDAYETRGMDGKVGKKATLFFAGPISKLKEKGNQKMEKTKKKKKRPYEKDEDDE